jgi:hypothetical protein
VRASPSAAAAMRRVSSRLRQGLLFMATTVSQHARANWWGTTIRGAGLNPL